MRPGTALNASAGLQRRQPIADIRHAATRWAATLIALILGVAAAHAVVEVDITRGNIRPLPIAIAPFGGGSSVVGGVEPAVEILLDAFCCESGQKQTMCLWQEDEVATRAIRPRPGHSQTTRAECGRSEAPHELRR